LTRVFDTRSTNSGSVNIFCASQIPFADCERVLHIFHDANSTERRGELGEQKSKLLLNMTATLVLAGTTLAGVTPEECLVIVCVNYLMLFAKDPKIL
jgi:hypothetical protein